MKKFVILIVALLLISGCSEVKPSDNNQTLVIIEDSMGQRQVKANPKRVAIFSMDILDIIDSVGLEHFEIERLGLAQDSVPEYLSPFKSKDYKNLGTLFEVNYDEMDLFDPQLIIIGGRLLPLVDELKTKYPDADIMDVSLPDYNLRDGLTRNVSNLSAIFSKAADKLDASLDIILNNMDELAKHTQDIKALFLLVNANTLSFYGKEGRFSMIYNEFNFEPADPSSDDGGSHGKSVSFEYVLEVDPPVIFMMDRGASIGDQATLDDVKHNPLLKQTQAALNQQIYALDPIAWYITTGGFKATMTMIQDMNQVLDQPIDIVSLP